jgi:hypothetical protein
LLLFIHLLDKTWGMDTNLSHGDYQNLFKPRLETLSTTDTNISDICTPAFLKPQNKVDRALILFYSISQKILKFTKTSKTLSSLVILLKFPLF